MPEYKLLPFDSTWLSSNVEISETDVKTKVATFTDASLIKSCSTIDWLAKSIHTVDLASLVGNETPDDVDKLCKQAASPLEGLKDCDTSRIQNGELGRRIHCAAVCVYPARIVDAVTSLKKLGVEKDVSVAAVAAGFPSGQFPLHTRLAEIYYAVASGAQEIDVVIDRSLVLRGLWQELYNELVQMRLACGQTCLKVILSVTECGTLDNIYKASMVAMMAGANFVKTSTGKEARTASIEEGYVMCLAIKSFYQRTSTKVGLKPAGGIRSAEHAVSWMAMVRDLLGEEWVDPSLFRIGTSGTSSMIPSVAAALGKL